MEEKTLKELRKLIRLESGQKQFIPVRDGLGYVYFYKKVDGKLVKEKNYVYDPDKIKLSKQELIIKDTPNIYTEIKNVLKQITLHLLICYVAIDENEPDLKEVLSIKTVLMKKLIGNAKKGIVKIKNKKKNVYKVAINYLYQLEKTVNEFEEIIKPENIKISFENMLNLSDIPVTQSTTRIGKAKGRRIREYLDFTKEIESLLKYLNNPYKIY